VIFCPPDDAAFRAARAAGIVGPGRCRGGYVPLIKEVVGLPGDVIRTTGRVTVAGSPIRNGEVDDWVASLCRLERPFETTLGASEVWLMSTKTRESFDSRYFGPIDVATIEAFVEPLWTW
jgi:conjugative transfer signal peptidase TraF